MIALFDTNILIDVLCGHQIALDKIKRYDQKAISRITWMEVLAGSQSEDETKTIKGFLNRFQVIDTNEEISLKTVSLRQQHRLKLPDAIIWATAKNIGALLITRDRKNFPESGDIHFPYQI